MHVAGPELRRDNAGDHAEAIKCDSLYSERQFTACRRTRDEDKRRPPLDALSLLLPTQRQNSLAVEGRSRDLRLCGTPKLLLRLRHLLWGLQFPSFFASLVFRSALH